MNLEEYFARIGFKGSYDKPDLATMKQIHKHHVQTVPSENLGLHSGEEVFLDLESIFDKIVRNNRGGYCLETNYLLNWVLRELGYDTTLLCGEVFHNQREVFNSRPTHALNRVDIDGKSYIADVSFGVSSQISEPLDLIAGIEQRRPAGIFHLTEMGDYWVLEKTVRKKVVDPKFIDSTLVDWKEKKPIYRFTLVPCQVEYIKQLSYEIQRDPDTLAMKKSICSLQTPTGFRALIGYTYSEVTFKPKEGVDVIKMRDISDDEVDTILWENFNVKLKNKLKPVNNLGNYTL